MIIANSEDIYYLSDMILSTIGINTVSILQVEKLRQRKVYSLFSK